MSNSRLTKSGIYIIRHVESNKIYIGSAVRLNKRWNFHRFKLRQNMHENSRLQNAWNKYGEDAFEFSIIELVSDKTKLEERKKAWSITRKGSVPWNKGISCSEESKRKQKLTKFAKKFLKWQGLN
jgi:group I intron endonuclease